MKNMVTDEELKKKSEDWEAFAKSMNLSKKDLSRMIDSDTKSLIRDLAMAFPDKISQIVNLAMLIETCCKNQI